MEHSETPGEQTLPEIDFGTFIMSLATSALMHLGEGESPEVDFPLAKQTIDIIGMLQDKTRGNLSKDEAKMLEDLLYDLRLRYLSARKQHTEKGS